MECGSYKSLFCFSASGCSRWCVVHESNYRPSIHCHPVLDRSMHDCHIQTSARCGLRLMQRVLFFPVMTIGKTAILKRHLPPFYLCVWYSHNSSLVCYCYAWYALCIPCYIRALTNNSKRRFSLPTQYSLSLCSLYRGNIDKINRLLVKPTHDLR